MSETGEARPLGALRASPETEKAFSTMLARTLQDWLNAGGPIEEVVDAITKLVRATIALTVEQLEAARIAPEGHLRSAPSAACEGVQNMTDAPLILALLNEVAALVAERDRLQEQVQDAGTDASGYRMQRDELGALLREARTALVESGKVCRSGAYRRECVEHAALNNGAHEPYCAAVVALVARLDARLPPP